MLKELSPYYQNLETNKQAMLRYMDGLSDSERQKRPKPKELAPIQVLAHIVKVEETVSGLGTAPKPGSRVGLKGRIFMATLVNMMRPGFRIPTIPDLQPKNPDSFEELKRSWDRARRELVSRVESVTAATKGEPVSNHLMAGPLNAQMALDFLAVHLRYHWKNLPKLKD